MIEIELEQVAYNRMIEKINKLSAKIKNMTPVWKLFIDYWQNEIMPGVLKTKGRLMGEKWGKYSPKYRAWKQKRYSGKPMLVLTGALASAMYGGPGWTQKISKQKLNIGVDISYAPEVQKRRPFFLRRDGTIPARALSWLMEKMREECTKEFE